MEELKGEIKQIQDDSGDVEDEMDKEWTLSTRPEVQFWRSGWEQNECRLATVLYTVL